MTLKRYDSCDTETLRFVCPKCTRETETVSRRNLCDVELPTKRCGKTSHEVSYNTRLISWPVGLCPQYSEVSPKVLPRVLKHSVLKALAFVFGLRWRSKTRVFGSRSLVESPKRGCDLGTGVAKRQHSKKTHYDCRLFLVISRPPSGPGLVFRSFAFRERGVLCLRC